jgi:hypothetical protein
VKKNKMSGLKGAERSRSGGRLRRTKAEGKGVSRNGATAATSGKAWINPDGFNITCFS